MSSLPLHFPQALAELTERQLLKSQVGHPTGQVLGQHRACHFGPPFQGGGHKPEPELDLLSNILKSFNEHFGTQFQDVDRVGLRIKEVAPKSPQVDLEAAAYQNAKANTPHTARMAHEQALGKVMQVFLKDVDFYKQFVQNPSFHRFLSDAVYAINTAHPPPHP